MAHQYANSGGVTTSSGRSIGLDSFIVTLGNFSGQTGTDLQIAATFAHELGHDLGLNHASPASSPGTLQYSPNYPSVMAYQYQLSRVKDRLESLGVVGADHLFKNLDYSHGRMPSIFEANLIEPDGVGIVPIDWDCDGLIGGTPVWTEVDAQSGWCTANVGTNLIADRDDWAEIEDNTDAVKRAKAQVRDYQCAGTEVLGDRLESGEDAVLEIESCTSADMYWLDPGGLAFASGTGESPISSVANATTAAPSGSILYFRPGTFTNSGNPLGLTKKVLFAGVGTAVIDP